MHSRWLPVWLAAVGGALYVAIEPHAADLAAASFRSDLFEREGFTLFNTAWYGGHHTPGYSILGPPLGALLGERLLGALSAVAATAAVTALAGRTAGLLFVPAILCSILSGRIPFTLGVAFAALALLAATRGRTGWAGAAAFTTALASPVAAMFLALIAAAFVLDEKRGGVRPLPTSGEGSPSLGRGLTPQQFWVVGGAAVVPTLFLVLAFPEGGTFPFVASAFWPAFAFGVAVAVFAPDGPIRITGALYAALCLVAFLFDTPIGGNAVRLGTLAVLPVAALLLWPRSRVALALLALPIAYWIVQPAYRDVARAMDDPSVEAAYHEPLTDWLEEREPLRVEIPLSQNHGEAEHVAREVAIGRGWERQLDLERNELFYEDGPLSPLEYERWLNENAIAYVALPEGLPLDASGEEEKTLIEREPAFLRQVARRGRWRIFRVRRPRRLATAPARMAALAPEGFTLRFARPGVTTVRVRFTPYWAFTRGHGCIGEAPGGWTVVRSRSAGTVRIRTRFSLGSVFRREADCSPG